MNYFEFIEVGDVMPEEKLPEPKTIVENIDQQGFSFSNERTEFNFDFVTSTREPNQVEDDFDLSIKELKYLLYSKNTNEAIRVISNHKMNEAYNKHIGF